MKSSNPKNRSLCSWFLAACALLTACVHYEDISNREPYSAMVGSRFELKQDCYVFRYHSRKQLYVINPSRDDTLPRPVDRIYVGKSDEKGEIVGIVGKGTLFTIVGCEDERRPESTYIDYKASFKITPFDNEVLDVVFLTDLTQKPPKFLEEMVQEVR